MVKRAIIMTMAMLLILMLAFPASNDDDGDSYPCCEVFTS